MTTVALTGPGIPRLSAVELRKMADTRAGFWLLLIVELLAATIVVIELIWGEPADRNFSYLFQSTVETISILLPVLGILAVTSEWSQRTGLTTFSLVPQRERVIAAKLIAAVALTVMAVTACLVTAAIGNLIAGGGWSFSLAALGKGALYDLIGVLGGVAFGLVFLSSALAIVLYYVIPTVWAILGETISKLDGVAEWLDLSRTMVPLTEGAMSAGEWARLGTSVALWVGALLVIGLVRLRRAELK